MKLNSVVSEVTEAIRQRSAENRAAYLARMRAAGSEGSARAQVGCANAAHAFAAFDPGDKIILRQMRAPSVAIVSSYNDMLSAHQPYAEFPDLIKAAAREAGAVAQFAGGVPAMCDGVTQGQPGMELSLFSRDAIAMATAIALSHDVFDATTLLGVCDKIVPGLLIGALHFGHLPALFVPAGPMSSGLANDEKSRIRQLHAQGKVGREALLDAEMRAYHGPGTCTFYGTANSNQMLMEVMGLHLPGAAFVHPGTPLRAALTHAAGARAASITRLGREYTPVADVVDERAIVNGIVGLLATGGSTNHTIHLVAIARAAGITINWDDFDKLSSVVPLIARVYPNGLADINHFHAAGGMGFVVAQLLVAGQLHEDVSTVAGHGLGRYAHEPYLVDGRVAWREAPRESLDLEVLRPVTDPFSPNGGLKLLAGNLGRAVIKVSAVAPEHHRVEAPAIVFDDQSELVDAFKAGRLERDFIAVVRFQGPRANGMPELHKLTPVLGTLQDRGFKVALLTDGRMSGASGKVPAAIHVTPESAAGGPLAKVRTGDRVLLDAVNGELSLVEPSGNWLSRDPENHDSAKSAFGLGRELFAGARALVSGAEAGATTF